MPTPYIITVMSHDRVGIVAHGRRPHPVRRQVIKQARRIRSILAPFAGG